MSVYVCKSWNELWIKLSFSKNLNKVTYVYWKKISLIENLSPGNEVNKDCMKIDAHGKKIYCSMSN